MENIYKFIDSRVINEEAGRWLIRLDGDEAPNAQDLEELHEWMSRSPLHREKLSQLASLWDKLNVLTELSVPLERQDSHSEVGAAAEFKTRIAARWAFFPQGLALAAVLVLGVFITLGTGWPGSSVDESNGRYFTEIGHQQELTLADGSKVQLNTNSELRVAYSEHYRDIFLLDGEVHFDVAKDKQKPFRVFAGNGRVQAIGTAFSVYLVDNNVKVTVTEGRVALAGVSKNSTSELRLESPVENLGSLAAGQGATIVQLDTSEDGSRPKPVLDNIQIFKQEELSRRLSWQQGLLVFTGEPLQQVVEEISRYTTISIAIPDPQVRAIKVGGQFEVGDTEIMLEALEDTFALRVVRNSDGSVQILAAGK